MDNWNAATESFWTWLKREPEPGVIDLRSEEQKRQAFEQDPRNLEPEHP